jgi:hypothetical protein
MRLPVRHSNVLCESSNASDARGDWVCGLGAPSTPAGLWGLALSWGWPFGRGGGFAGWGGLAESAIR